MSRAPCRIANCDHKLNRGKCAVISLVQRRPECSPLLLHKLCFYMLGGDIISNGRTALLSMKGRLKLLFPEKKKDVFIDNWYIFLMRSKWNYCFFSLAYYLGFIHNAGCGHMLCNRWTGVMGVGVWDCIIVGACDVGHWD